MYSNSKQKVVFDLTCTNNLYWTMGTMALLVLTGGGVKSRLLFITCTLSIIAATVLYHVSVLQKKTRLLCHYYNTLIPEDKTLFLHILAADYCVDHRTVQQLAGHIGNHDIPQVKVKDTLVTMISLR